jgi:hypothetical protein
MSQPRKIFYLIFLLASNLMASGCATVLNSKITKSKLVSVPPGASVVVGDGLATCKAPCEIKLKTEESLPFTANLEGYGQYRGKLTRRIAASFWFNFWAVLAGPIGLPVVGAGMATDYLTGNIWTWRNLKFKMPAIGEEEKEEDVAPAVEKIVEEPLVLSPSKPAMSSDLPTMTAQPPKGSEVSSPGGIRGRFPKVLVGRRIEWFFGSQNSGELELHIECAYQLLENHQGGEEFSLDDAVKLANGQHKEPCGI